MTRFAGQPDYEWVRQRRHERREAAARIEAVATAARPHHEHPPMLADEIRFLSAYDRWATRQVLTVLDGLDLAAWRRSTVLRRPETMEF